MLKDRIEIVQQMSQDELWLLRQGMNATHPLWLSVQSRLRPMAMDRNIRDLEQQAAEARQRNLKRQAEKREQASLAGSM